jgi:hypothetical protein
LFLKFLLIFKLFFGLHLVKTAYNKPTNKVSLQSQCLMLQVEGLCYIPLPFLSVLCFYFH